MKLFVALSSLIILAYFVSSGSGQVIEAKRSGTWCIARLSATDVELTNNINFVCQNLKVKNCKQMIEEGGYCRDPNTLINHASVVMNSYYAENGRNWWNCDFKGTGVVAISNPSYGKCIYD